MIAVMWVATLWAAAMPWVGMMLGVLKLRREASLMTRTIVNTDREKALRGKKFIPIDSSIAIHPSATMDIDNSGHERGGDRVGTDNLDHQRCIIHSSIWNIWEEYRCERS